LLDFILVTRCAKHESERIGQSCSTKKLKKNMNTYRSPGFRNVTASSMSEAAEIFAARAARSAYGRNGYARTCTLGSWSQDGSLGEYSAFIGYSSGRNETTGHNTNFTVYGL